MQEQVNSLMDGFKNRFNNPFVSAFIISFTVFNWDAFYLLLWDTTKNATDRIAEFQGITLSIGLPILIAILFPLLSPFLKAIAETVDDCALWVKTNLQAAFNERGFVRVDKFISIRRQLTDAQSTLDAKDQKISELLETINALDGKDTKIDHATLPPKVLQPQITRVPLTSKIDDIKDGETYTPGQVDNYLYGESLTGVQKRVRLADIETRILQIKGTIYTIEVEDDGPVMSITSEFDGQTIYLDCHFDFDDEKILEKLHVGDSIKIQGQFTSVQDDESHAIYSCKLIK